MGDEEGVQHVSTVEDALFHQRVEGDGLLKARWSNVLSVFQLELGLDATGDGQVAIGR